VLGECSVSHGVSLHYALTTATTTTHSHDADVSLDGPTLLALVLRRYSGPNKDGERVLMCACEYVIDMCRA
jgi:hypothetical protein